MYKWKVEAEGNTQLSFWKRKSQKIKRQILPWMNLSLFFFFSRLGSAEEKPNDQRFKVHFVCCYRRESLFWNENLSISIVLLTF